VIYIEEDPVTEVHRIRAELLREYGGIKGYLKHLDEELPGLEQAGWHFVTAEEIAALRQRSGMAV
jgi:hypothetical protein